MNITFIKCMINNHDVIFCESYFKISNKHTTIVILFYVRLDIIFVDNSTSTQLDDIKAN
jgi:hypothetical protein